MGPGRDTRSSQRGQAAVLIALSLFSMVVFLAMATNFGILVNDRIRMQNAADLAAYAGAFEQARVMNRMTQLNARIHHVAAMTRKHLTCQDLPSPNEGVHVGDEIDNNGDWENNRGYTCGGGTRTLIAVG